MVRKKKFALSPTHIILLSFLITIFVGSLLLSLPISTKSGAPVPYVDALFTATTATCITGLVTLPTASTWSLFGQIVILVMIQIGGVGVVTVISGIMRIAHRKMGINDRLVIQDAFNLNTMSGLAKFVKNVLLGTFIIEGIGALLYMIAFVPKFGAKGVWISIFNSVSAFCNAGIDIIGENSLCDYATNPLVNAVTAALIVVGGIGFIVWWDLLRAIKMSSPKNRRFLRHLSLHSKIAISATLGLILVGGLLIFAFEYSNPLTIGNMGLFDKLQVSFFQSVTTRTAGFASVPQENLTNASTILSMVLMSIGGSPVGTAGGIKTVTVAVLICSAFATIRNKKDTTLFGRQVANDSIRKAVAIVSCFFVICILATLLLVATNDISIVDALYETVSGVATVGLSRNITPSLNTFGKIIIIITMYLGRVGPISLAVALGSKKNGQNIVTEPIEEISIG